jgi:hypothetical protein
LAGAPAANEDLDLEPLLVDMQRRVRFTALPKDPFVVRFEVRGPRRFCCSRRPKLHFVIRTRAFPTGLRAGTAGRSGRLWRGDMSFVEAQRMGLSIDGPKRLPGLSEVVRPLSFAHIEPAGRKTDKSAARALTAIGAS